MLKGTKCNKGCPAIDRERQRRRRVPGGSSLDRIVCCVFWKAGLGTKSRHLGSICLRTGCVSVRVLRKPYECLYIYSWVVQQRTAGIYELWSPVRVTVCRGL
jgi:hypothetical protein